MNTFIYAIALMLYTGPPAEGTDWKVAKTKVFVTAPHYKNSETCQQMAMAFNEARNFHFVGNDTSYYRGMEGHIIGAWCIVPVKLPPTKTPANELKPSL